MVDRHPLEVLLKLDRNFRSGLSSTNSVPCGLKNLGNTCYLNACLQMLSAASGFVNTFGGADVDESLPARALPNSEAGATELKNSIVGELQKILGSCNAATRIGGRRFFAQTFSFTSKLFIKFH